MKKKKLNLGQIEVQSFVTSLQNEKVNTVKGAGLETFICKFSINFPCNASSPCGPILSSLPCIPDTEFLGCCE
ncbi:pinensin family lanthipeptide [Xanthovirga aplysinae]|uniref:pinensin family lanthipeptide n=1 Tax=Xanthovirga aplysinae TaxID=2529853 RepID=UPI0012BC13BC|nr:pinensin family lanthipeptide [Xanthovirga aplysinae]MTI29543.1 hypothetical protein [Xanthovirga aplysinae]